MSLDKPAFWEAGENWRKGKWRVLDKPINDRHTTKMFSAVSDNNVNYRVKDQAPWYADIFIAIMNFASMWLTS